MRLAQSCSPYIQATHCCLYKDQILNMVLKAHEMLLVCSRIMLPLLCIWNAQILMPNSCGYL